MTAVFSILGLAVGIVLGLFFPMYIPPEYTTYVAVALLAAIDSLLGALHAQAKQTFQFNIFVTGFFFNMLMAVVLTYFGNLLSLDLYLAAVVVFGTRIFQNIAGLRRILLNWNSKTKKDDV